MRPGLRLQLGDYPVIYISHTQFRHHKSAKDVNLLAICQSAKNMSMGHVDGEESRFGHPVQGTAAVVARDKRSPTVLARHCTNEPFRNGSCPMAFPGAPAL